MNAFRLLIAFIAVHAGGGLSVATTTASRVEIADAAQPQLAVGPDGRVWLAYGRFTAPAAPATTAGHGHKGHQPQARPGDVFVAVSEDGGTTFQPAVKVASLPGLMLGMRRGPRVVAHGDRLTVTVIAHELLAYTSLDGGRSWSGPTVVNAVPTSAREGLHDLAGAADGRLFVTWLDLRNERMEVWGAGSVDGGRTWSVNERVYRSPDKSVCECCHPSALFDAGGNLAVMWRNSIKGTRDLWLTMRASGATHFSEAVKLGEGTWTLNACPMDGGRIVSLEPGQFAAVWNREGVVYFSPTDGPERALSPGRQPVVLVQPGGPLFVWQQGTGLSLRRGFAHGEAEVFATEGRFPSVASIDQGRGALVAYEQGPAKALRVVVDRL